MTMEFDVDDGLSFIKEENIKVLDGYLGFVDQDIVLATNLDDRLEELLESRDQESLYENVFVFDNRRTLDSFKESILSAVNSLDYGGCFHDLFVFLSSAKGMVNEIKMAEGQLEETDYTILIYFVSQDYYEDFVDKIFEMGLDSERVMLIESDHKEGRLSQGFYI